MADRVQRPESFVVYDEAVDDNSIVYSEDETTVYMDQLETELCDLKALHADIIDQGRKVQIAASGDSKYGAMSDSEYIEWMLGKLEGANGKS